MTTTYSASVSVLQVGDASVWQEGFADGHGKRAFGLYSAKRRTPEQVRLSIGNWGRCEVVVQLTCCHTQGLNLHWRGGNTKLTSVATAQDFCPAQITHLFQPIRIT